MLRSAGLLPYRLHPVAVLIAHPGGPFWSSKDEGAWSIAKGLVEEGEVDEEAARREFEEETGWPAPSGEYHPLGDTRLASGKLVVAWAVQAGDLDPDTLEPGSFELEWPPASGRTHEFPEIDRVAWCEPEEARRLLNPAQRVFVDRLEQILADTP